MSRAGDHGDRRGEATSEPSAARPPASSHDALANELLADTVRHAVEAPFYAELYSRHGIDADEVTTVGELSALPIVDKALLRAAGADARREAGPISHLQNTSGTTEEPFVVARAVWESQFIDEFFGRVNRPSPGAIAPIMLQTQFPDHGTSTSIPAHVFVVPFSVTDERVMDHALLMLRKEFDVPGVDRRVSIVSGSHTGILALTSCLVERGIHCDEEFEVSVVHLEGRYLTRRWRTVLEDVWGALVSDKYSLAEVFGGATHCPRCGSFHFDPFVVAEIVDAHTRRPVERGTGVLVLTSLFPFVQAQPMIRYWTGDLFEELPSVCRAAGYAYRGRLNHALLDGDEPGRVLITGVDVLEAVDGAPEVNRTARFRDVVSMRYPQAAGEVRVEGVVDRGPGARAITLNVEVTFQPGLYPQREAALRREVAERLVSSCPNLADAIGGGRASFDVRLVAPGAAAPLERYGELWRQR